MGRRGGGVQGWCGVSVLGEGRGGSTEGAGRRPRRRDQSRALEGERQFGRQWPFPVGVSGPLLDPRGTPRGRRGGAGDGLRGLSPGHPCCSGEGPWKAT